MKLQIESYTNIYLQKSNAHTKAAVNRYSLSKFEVGEKDMLYHNQGFGRNSKLSTQWNGPIEIIEKTGMDNYTLKEDTN